jgi:hypothetical protein
LPVYGEICLTKVFVSADGVIDLFYCGIARRLRLASGALCGKVFQGDALKRQFMMEFGDNCIQQQAYLVETELPAALAREREIVVEQRQICEMQICHFDQLPVWREAREGEKVARCAHDRNEIGVKMRFQCFA